MNYANRSLRRTQTIDEVLDQVEQELIEIRQGKPPPHWVWHRDGDHIWAELVKPPWKSPINTNVPSWHPLEKIIMINFKNMSKKNKIIIGVVLAFVVLAILGATGVLPPPAELGGIGSGGN